MAFVFTDEQIKAAIAKYNAHMDTRSIVDSAGINQFDPHAVEAFRLATEVIVDEVVKQASVMSPDMLAMGWYVLRRRMPNIRTLLGEGPGLREVFVSMLQTKLKEP